MSLRVRLTVLYSGLFLLASGALLAITYLLLARALPREPLLGDTSISTGDSRLQVELPAAFRETLDQEAAQQRAAALQQLLVQSAVALTVTAVLALVLGWLVAGRVLHPLRRIIDATHRLSPDRLHERIRLHRPDDEFKNLAETFNAMLARLESGFALQRRFAANVSHELRTPLTVQRSAVDVALADPEPSVESLLRMAAQVRRATERHERIIDSLLVLARSQEGIAHPRDVDLAGVCRAVSADSAPDPHDVDPVRIDHELRPAPVPGDETLLERLIANLVGNAVAYNVPGGWVRVSTYSNGGQAVVEVANSGPYVPPALVARLFEPFRRNENGRSRRGRRNRGVGLGLSIVAAVAASHRGTVAARSRDDGGLEVTVTLPAASTAEGRRAEAAPALSASSNDLRQ